MSSPDKPSEPRSARRARPRPSLKMQAIGFLSRREHSRQELRSKLLDSLRRRAREDAALAAAAEETARAAQAQPSNGIDDAFSPRAATPATPSAAAPARAALDTLTLATGAALPTRLRVSLESIPGQAPARSELAAPADAASTPMAADVDAPDDADLERSDPEAAVDRLLDWLAANSYLSDARFVESRVNARSRKQGTLRIKIELSRHGLALAPEQAAVLRETEFTRARELWQRKFGEVATDPRQRAKQARFLAARGFAADVVRRIVGGLEED